MSSKILKATAPLLAVAALAPAAASATTLHGAPTLRHIEGGKIQLQFTTAEKVSVKKTKVTVNGEPIDFLKQTGRHGKDFVYKALVKVPGLEDGHKYQVRFRFPDGDTAIRLSKLL